MSHELRRFPLSIVRFAGVEAQKTSLFAMVLIGTSVSKTKMHPRTNKMKRDEFCGGISANCGAGLIAFQNLPIPDLVIGLTRQR